MVPLVPERPRYCFHFSEVGFLLSTIAVVLCKNFTVLEMACLDGKVLLNKSGGKVAYCAQTPCKSSWFHKIAWTHWALGLEHATIRDNITFGSRFGHSNDGFDEVRYDAVLESCALKRDLAIFEAGDLTGKHLGRAKCGFNY